MGKRGRFLIAIAAIAVLAVLAWAILLSPAPEPFYKGKPLSYWLQGYTGNPGTNPPPTYAEANAAVDEIGTNAIPVLLQMLRAQDSPIKTKVIIWARRYRLIRNYYTVPSIQNIRARQGFEELGPRAIIAVPDLIKILDDNRSPRSQWAAACSLGSIGPGAKAAVPSLLREAVGTNQPVRMSSIMALGDIHEDPNTVVPFLIKTLHDPLKGNRSNAAFALGSFGAAATSAVPALVALFNDPNVNSNPTPPVASFDVRSNIKYALQQIDPKVYARVVTNGVPAPTQ